MIAAGDPRLRRLARAFSALCLLVLIAGVAAVIHLHPRPLPPGLPPLTGVIDRITVEKAARRMTLWQDGRAVRVYGVALGFQPVGDKLRQGDGKTPEGPYLIDRRNAASAYTLSLGLDYPRAEDRARAAAGGYDPGGDIMIHGQPNGMPDAAVLKGDWTAGCIALSNADMREIWAVAPTGTPVVVMP